MEKVEWEVTQEPLATWWQYETVEADSINLSFVLDKYDNQYWLLHSIEVVGQEPDPEREMVESYKVTFKILKKKWV